MPKRMFYFSLAMFALLLLCAFNAQATPITWYLQGVKFADGSTASGSFVYDVDNGVNGTYSNISITTTAGTTVTANAFIYINPNAVSFSIRVFPVTTTGDLTGLPELNFHFPAPGLTDAGGTVPLVLSGAQTSGWDLCADPQCYTSSAFIDVTAGVVTTAGDPSYYFTTYFSNANTANAPDATIRAINDGDTGANLYASIYVFDDSEELTQCCSCFITPDGLLSESVNRNLTANPLTGIKPTRGVIKIISSSTEADVTTNFAPNTPVSGIRAWATHVQKLTSGYAVSETTLADSNLVPSEQLLLEQLCYFDHQLSGKPCTCTPEDQDF